MKMPKRLPGFTLIELLLTMGLLLPFLTVIIWLMSEMSSAQLYFVNYDTAARETQFASIVIGRDLDLAETVLIPTSASESAHTLTVMTETGLVSIASVEGRLVRTDSSGSAYLLSNRSKLETFAVSRSGTESALISVDLVVAASVSGQREPFRIERTVNHHLY